MNASRTEPPSGLEEALQRNLRLYPVYAALFNALFWLPVFFLFFNSLLPLERVLQLEALYYVVVVLLEVPSGYFSDVAGRKRTLLIATGCGAAAAGLFLGGHDFQTLALGQIALAASIAFNSGTDAAFHYDSLARLGRAGEFEQREANVARNALSAGAVAALLGGLVAILELRLAYLLHLAAMGGALLLIARTVEPDAGSARQPHAGFFRQVRNCLSLLRKGRLAWVSGFLVFMVIINHMPYEFYQPYIRIQFEEDSLLRGATPLVSGGVTAVTMILASIAAGMSHRLRQRWGLFRTLMTAAGLQVVIIASMAWIASPLIILLIFLRSVPRGLMTAPLNAAIAPLVPQAMRASFLSILNLAGKLGFAVLLFSLSHAPFIRGIEEEAGLARALSVCFVLAFGGMLLLLATGGVIRKAASQTPPAA